MSSLSTARHGAQGAPAARPRGISCLEGSGPPPRRRCTANAIGRPWGGACKAMASLNHA